MSHDILVFNMLNPEIYMQFIEKYSYIDVLML